MAVSAVIAAIFAPLIYTRRSIDLMSTLTLVTIPLCSLYWHTQLTRLVTFRQLLARFCFGWCLLLPIAWILGGFIVALTGNFLFVSTYLPAVMSQLVELSLWIGAFTLVSVVEEWLKTKAETDQHFFVLPPLCVFTALGSATSLGLGVGTSYYLGFFARYWAEKRCEGSTECSPSPAYMLGIVVLLLLFSAFGQVCGWYFNALTSWHWITANHDNRERWNPRFKHLALGRGVFSGIIVFCYREVDLWALPIAAAASLGVLFMLRHETQKYHRDMDVSATPSIA